VGEGGLFANKFYFREHVDVQVRVFLEISFSSLTMIIALTMDATTPVNHFFMYEFVFNVETIVNDKIDHHYRF
jgi:hypothetical protein